MADIAIPYIDYCISDECLTNGSWEKVKNRLLELGYHTVAVNQTIEESNAEPKRKKKKGETREVVDLVPVPHSFANSSGPHELKVLNRLTITFGNQDFVHKITKSPNYKKYHIVAVFPTTQAAFQYVCTNLEADIVTFNPENKLPFKLSRKLYNQLISRRYHFEIQYAPTIIDTTKRRNIIYIAHLYHTYGKSRNIIISSGANNESLIRNPYDVMNLGLIFGLNKHQAKIAIKNNCQSVYTNSVGRKFGRSVIYVENVEKECEETKEGTKIEFKDDSAMETNEQPEIKRLKIAQMYHE